MDLLKFFRGGTNGASTGPSKVRFAVFALPLVILILAAGWLIWLMTTKGSAGDELQTGLFVVASIATLMTVLFVIAAGFSSMKLTDSSQPLGLPEGSIRAMIALILIMVFIIFGIYLFRSVGNGSSSFVGKMPTLPDDPKKFGGRTFTFEYAPPTKAGEQGLYSVWITSDINPDAKGLAQQLLTTVGTLVVAVAGFYFGSTTAKSGAASSTPSNPVIKDLTPRQGAKNSKVDLEITGSGFANAKNVRLVRGNEQMIGTDVLSNDTKIHCKLSIDKEPGAKFDLVIETDDGKQAKLSEIFTIAAA